MKKILFVCSANKLRSPTAEAVFAEYQGWEVRSAGISHKAVIQLGIDDIEWADIIFVMEEIHKTKMQKKFRNYLKDQRVICLGIPDEYSFMDEELIKILIKKVPQFV